MNEKDIEFIQAVRTYTKENPQYTNAVINAACHGLLANAEEQTAFAIDMETIAYSATTARFKNRKAFIREKLEKNADNLRMNWKGVVI